ncbi:UbiX family flavin prenyltransferase [Candidatus Sumerlaeota bacterium]|nr:UbiX family flavin prenyltransferase [Candidatus Sumerlaeota bacterium]
MSERDVIVGMTGASGAIYAQAVVREMLAQGLTVHFIPTVHAGVVWQNEMDMPTTPTAAERQIAPAPSWAARLNIPPGSFERLVVYDDGDVGSEPASGTFRARGMVVVPCSMNTLAKIAHGIADTLLTRAAGVCLKERRPLVLVPRETPLSLADLRNQVAAAEAGAIVLPASPAFYHRPVEIGDLVHSIVSRVCNQLGLPCEQPIRYTKQRSG